MKHDAALKRYITNVLKEGYTTQEIGEMVADILNEEEKKTNPMGMIYDENNVSGSNPSSNKSNSQSNQSKSDESGNKSVASNQESEVNTGNVQVNLINPRDRRTNNNLINNPSLTTKIKL